MIKWTPYVFVRLLLYLITGILLACYSNISLTLYQAIFNGFLGLLGIYWLLYGWKRIFRKEKRFSGIFGLLAFLIVLTFGYIITYRQSVTYQTDHIFHEENVVSYYTGTVISQVQERPNTYKATLAIDKIYTEGKWKNASGNVLIFLNKKGKLPHYGTQLLVKGTPQQIAAPLNPGEFDYQHYLHDQHVYHQHVVAETDFISYGTCNPNPVFAWSIKLRQYADHYFKNAISTQHEYAIASGLILGVRDGLDNQIKQAYASAGAMHVLAVSGAHVAIVFQFLVLLLGKLKDIRYGNWIFAIVVLGILWFYAFVTGMSASVLRAVVMFTFIVIAQASRRRSNVYNTLAASAFVLLCTDAYLIRDVGFQLSYIAVLGILYLFPKLYHSFDFKNYLADKAWAVTCVSIAAMVATVPMSLFYFHQFPTYFLLSNVPVILFSSGVLYLGLGVLLFSWVPYLSFALAFLLEKMVWLLNQSVFITESLPGALIKGISVSLAETLLLYGIIVCILLFIHYKKLFIWRIVFCLAVAVTTNYILETVKKRQQQRLAIYAIPNKSALSIVSGNRQSFFASPELLTDKNLISFHLTNHFASQGISERRYSSFEAGNLSGLAFKHFEGYSLLIWQEKTFLFFYEPVDKHPTHLPQMKFDFLIIQNNALRKLDKLPVQAKKLIIDSSNKKYVAKRLKQQATNLQIACHSVYEDGAFILNE